MTQYLSRQIADMEDELASTQSSLRDSEEELSKARDYISDLEFDLEEANKFIEYIDKTHPELSTAYEASLVLEGESK
jgi:septal ring factor EnvC (AmiA/AmiB activator)